MSYSNEVLTQIQAERAAFKATYDEACAKFSEAAVNALFQSQFNALKATLTAQIATEAKAQTASALQALQNTAKSETNAYLTANKAEIIAAAAAKVDTATLAAQQVAAINADIRANLQSATAAALNSSDLAAYTANLKTQAQNAATAATTSLKTTLADATTDINAKRAEVRNFDITAMAQTALNATIPQKLDNFLADNKTAIINSNAVKSAAAALINTADVKTSIQDAVTQNILLSDFEPQVKAALDAAAQKAADDVFELPKLKYARFLHALYMKLFTLQAKQAHLLWMWDGLESGSLWIHKIFKHR